ncbi:transcription antiterminator BglG [Bacillus aerophilus]|uniref:PRD domain-containing protein n=1 Tax=Bacillus altitudinis TaxID=293387 RepID=UPI000FF8E254|nr:transcription antiterminator BglG [Bacillus aerophilus]
MFKIKKVLNSSVVLAEDQNQQEMVLFGRGIGYGQKPGQMIEEKKADQVFMSVDNMRAKEFLQLLDSMPQEFIDLTQHIVQYAEKRLNSSLNSGVYFTLMDHLNFAVERHKKNINITNRVYWEIKNYYTEEFEVGNYALELVNNTLGIQLPKEEAANIAFHLINALGEESDSKDGMKYAKMIGSIMNLVRYTLNMKMDQENIHYSRFITHVKFFVERFYANKLLSDQENELFEQIAHLYPQAMDVAFKIKDYIKQVHSIVIPNDELTYLAVHIHRLISYQELK